MKVYLKQVDRYALVAKGESNHWVSIDDEVDGWIPSASSPMELMLMSIAACSAMDVISILEKRRSNFTDLAIEVNGVRRDEYPRIYTAIHLKYIVSGSGIKSKDIERAIKLSEDKYCSAIGMVKDTAKMSSEYVIEEIEN